LELRRYSDGKNWIFQQNLISRASACESRELIDLSNSCENLDAWRGTLQC
jgi:hypothetical protein